MNLKWIGAILIVSGCGGFGFSMAAGHRKTEQMLRQLISALDRMEWELSYRLSSLPELCLQACSCTKGSLREVFRELGAKLEQRVSTDAGECMENVLGAKQDLPRSVRSILIELGASLGRFDLQGQLKGLEAVKQDCMKELENMEYNRDLRLRSYKALGLCAGVGLAILFL